MERTILSIQVEMIHKIEHREMIGAVSNRSRAGVGQGIEPDERMHEDRRERLAQTHSRARIAALVCFDDAMIARFLRRLFDENNEQDRNQCDEKRWNAK